MKKFFCFAMAFLLILGIAFFTNQEAFAEESMPDSVPDVFTYENGYYYYYYNGRKLLGIQEVDGHLYYFNPHLMMGKEFTDSVHRYYSDATSGAIYTFAVMDGETCYVPDENGYVQYIFKENADGTMKIMSGDPRLSEAPLKNLNRDIRLSEDKTQTYFTDSQGNTPKGGLYEKDGKTYAIQDWGTLDQGKYSLIKDGFYSPDEENYYAFDQNGTSQRKYLYRRCPHLCC